VRIAAYLTANVRRLVATLASTEPAREDAPGVILRGYFGCQTLPTRTRKNRRSSSSSWPRRIFRVHGVGVRQEWRPQIRCILGVPSVGRVYRSRAC
jgi:hypothetical protein